MKIGLQAYLATLSTIQTVVLAYLAARLAPKRTKDV